MLDKRPRLVKGIIALVASVLIFGFAGWLLFNRQYAIDLVSVWSYERPASVQAMEERIEFTDKGTFYFHASQPVVSTAEDFNQQCPRQEVGSPILGCYSMGRIYIYDVTNEKLDGIEEVTAAHEMLHAVWERMSPYDQKKIGALLRTEYARLDDAELKERMDYYDRTEPGEFENELHSIIPTEVDDLDPKLESYYAQYFEDRSRVVALHDQYNSVFTKLADRADVLYEELSELGPAVESRSAQYNQAIAQLSADIDAFNARADSGDFSSMSEFNSERESLLARTNQLEIEYNALNRAIESYNDKYEEYQSIATQLELLSDSIDSINDLEPAPSI